MNKTGLILILLSFGFFAKAQPYLLFERDTAVKNRHIVYLFDANLSTGIHQDDRLIDSIVVILKTPISASKLSMSVGNPLITGDDLSLEISLFEVYNQVDPRDDRLLQTLIWQGQVSDFRSLNLPEPKRINTKGLKTKLEPKKMRLNLDTLFHK